jgi:uncharacterized protein YqjF (DUF2071 family)
MTPTDTGREAERNAPAGPCIGYQRWDRLLFAHWKVPAAAVQSLLPRGLFVDTHRGEAYLGLVPFFMQRVRPRGLPPLPGISWFLELNVRTYVHDAQGRPGVWFFSLDCNQSLAVAAARRFFHLPYEHATMTATVAGDTCDFSSRRRGVAALSDRFVWSAPTQGGWPAVAGSLESFLVERYRLFTARPDGTPLTAGVRHAPYWLHVPVVRRWSTTVAKLAGFTLRGPPDSLLAADTVDVAIHPIRAVLAPSRP